MKLETIKEKKDNNISKLKNAKWEVVYIRVKLRENLEYINDIFSFLKKLKKVKYCFDYIKANWYYDIEYEDEIEKVKRRIEDYSNLYEKAILKRKILKLKLKQAQREFTKKQKSLIREELKLNFKERKENGKRQKNI